MWNHEFLVIFEILVGDDELTTELVVENIDAKTFSFTIAFHSCLKGELQSLCPISDAGTSEGLASDSSSKHGRLLQYRISTCTSRCGCNSKLWCLFEMIYINFVVCRPHF